MGKKTTWMLSFILLSVAIYAQDYSMVKLKPINNKIELKLESCVRDGNSVTITYYLRNNTRAGVKMIYIGSISEYCSNNKGENTLVVDNLGYNYTGDHMERNYNTYQELCGVKSNTMEDNGAITVTLPSDVWVKGIYVLKNVNPAAKFFQLVNIAFTQYGGLCRAKR